VVRNREGKPVSATCPTCAGTGFEIRARPDGGSEAARCNCVLEDRSRTLLRSVRIPRRYDHCTLDSFELHHPSLEKARQVSQDWTERWPIVEHGLLFLGQPGTGKTHLAVSIARELVQAKQARVLFCEQRELLKSLQGTYDAGASLREAEVLGPVLGAEVLILDDLGAGRITPWARDVLNDVIVHRYNEKLPLIMTSNHPTGEDEHEGRNPQDSRDRVTLKDRLGDALMSRIHEMCLDLTFEGMDYRRGVRHARHHF